ncbi:hypothetical protein OS493_009668 [Desmophyllum pertusum]|uniref:Uncharacterized protein n=1 Tax=Desmophyllum pertusum TaxID=174260 RepID=A0A9W9YTY1_9CNID|nr:hypothetical protein OS493_009668 [Desmophyllum pertusum]
MALCQWDFQHLEVIGTKCSCPPEWDEIRGRIPQLKVETRKRIDVRKESPTAEPRIPARSSSAKQLLHVKPPKEKVVTVKVVLPKKKPEVIERNYLCTCDEERSVQSLKDGVGVVEEIEFNELMKVFLKYGEGPRKQSSKTLRNIARGFQGSRILSSDEALQVLKLLDTDNYGLKEGVLLMTSQLCTSTLNVRRFLEKGLLDELINVMLLGGDDNTKKEAVFCLSKVVEKTEHADLWLEVMTISGAEALFGLLTASGPLQHTVLLAIKNLAAHPKMARLLIEYGLESVTQLASCKNANGTYTGNPEIQGLVTHTLTNLISHDSSTVEMFLSKYDDVITNVVDLLQYSPCLQQQESARLLATLAFYKPGLSSLVSHNAVEHLLWAVTCSQCRRVREQASIALKNISANPDKSSAFSALSQVAVKNPIHRMKEVGIPIVQGYFSSSEKNLQRQSTSHFSLTSSHGTLTDRETSLKNAKDYFRVNFTFNISVSK